MAREPIAVRAWLTLRGDARFERQFPDGSVEQDGVFHGVAWEVSKGRARVKAGVERDFATLETALHDYELWRDWFARADLEAIDLCRGAPCHRIRLTPKNKALQPEKVWLLKRTGLLVRSSRLKPVDGGWGETGFAWIDDYRLTPFGVNVPFRSVLAWGDLQLVTTYSKIEHHADFTGEELRYPPAVADLLAQRR